MCRLGFYHEYETAVYSHPSRKRPAASFVWRRLRKGKDLVLPDGARIEYGPPQEGQGNPPAERLVLDEQCSYGPWPHRCNRYGRAGRVDVVRYHPYHGSTNPVGQVCLRSNLDVQCLDRVVLDLPGDDSVGGAPAADGDPVVPPPPEPGAFAEPVGDASEALAGAETGGTGCEEGTVQSGGSTGTGVSAATQGAGGAGEGSARAPAAGGGGPCPWAAASACPGEEACSAGRRPPRWTIPTRGTSGTWVGAMKIPSIWPMRMTWVRRLRRRRNSAA